MGSKDEEYKEMFLAEALDNYEELNNLFTKLEKDLDSPTKGRRAGRPVESINSFSECHLCSTSLSGVVLTTTECSPFDILSRIRRTSFLVSPVITATREILVGRPRSPYSDVPTSTKAVFEISENSRWPIPCLNRILARGFSAMRIAPRIWPWMLSDMVAKYIVAPSYLPTN